MRKHPSLPAVLTSAAGRLFLFRTAFCPNPLPSPFASGKGGAPEYAVAAATSLAAARTGAARPGAMRSTAWNPLRRSKKGNFAALPPKKKIVVKDTTFFPCAVTGKNSGFVYNGNCKQTPNFYPRTKITFLQRSRRGDAVQTGALAVRNEGKPAAPPSEYRNQKSPVAGGPPARSLRPARLRASRCDTLRLAQLRPWAGGKPACGGHAWGRATAKPAMVDKPGGGPGAR